MAAFIFEVVLIFKVVFIFEIVFIWGTRAPKSQMGAITTSLRPVRLAGAKLWVFEVAMMQYKYKLICFRTLWARHERSAFQSVGVRVVDWQ